jgi:hypothetical protein
LITHKREKPSLKKVTIVEERSTEHEGSKDKAQSQVIEMEKGPAAIKALEDRAKNPAADV